MWINQETQQTYANHSEIRAAYPQVSLPAELSDGFIASLGLVATEPPAPPPPTVADFDAALTRHLDATAQARRYDNRITCATHCARGSGAHVDGAGVGAGDHDDDGAAVC